jgi:hypothetical protein
MILAKETRKSEGPACACGRPDLYEESLKLKDNNHKEDQGSTTSSQDKIIKSPGDSSGMEEQ